MEHKEDELNDDTASVDSWDDVNEKVEIYHAPNATHSRETKSLGKYGGMNGQKYLITKKNKNTGQTTKFFAKDHDTWTTSLEYAMYTAFAKTFCHTPTIIHKDEENRLVWSNADAKDISWLIDHSSSDTYELLGILKRCNNINNEVFAHLEKLKTSNPNSYKEVIRILTRIELPVMLFGIVDTKEDNEMYNSKTGKISFIDLANMVDFPSMFDAGIYYSDLHDARPDNLNLLNSWRKYYSKYKDITIVSELYYKFDKFKNTFDSFAERCCNIDYKKLLDRYAGQCLRLNISKNDAYLYLQQFMQIFEVFETGSSIDKYEIDREQLSATGQKFMNEVLDGYRQRLVNNIRKNRKEFWGNRSYFSKVFENAKLKYSYLEKMEVGDELHKAGTDVPQGLRQLSVLNNELHKIAQKKGIPFVLLFQLLGLFRERAKIDNKNLSNEDINKIAKRNLINFTRGIISNPDKELTNDDYSLLNNSSKQKKIYIANVKSHKEGGKKAVVYAKRGNKKGAFYNRNVVINNAIYSLFKGCPPQKYYNPSMMGLCCNVNRNDNGTQYLYEKDEKFCYKDFKYTDQGKAYIDRTHDRHCDDEEPLKFTNFFKFKKTRPYDIVDKDDGQDIIPIRERIDDAILECLFQIGDDKVSNYMFHVDAQNNKIDSVMRIDWPEDKIIGTSKTLNSHKSAIEALQRIYLDGQEKIIEQEIKKFLFVKPETLINWINFMLWKSRDENGKPLKPLTEGEKDYILSNIRRNIRNRLLFETSRTNPITASVGENYLDNIADNFYLDDTFYNNRFELYDIAFERLAEEREEINKERERKKGGGKQKKSTKYFKPN